MPVVRRIKKVDVKFVSLCSRGKNGLGVLYKSDNTVELQSLCKMTEQGHLLSVVYPANRLDADLMFADESVCQEMCESHAENGLQLDIHHDGRVLSKADIFVAENFIIQRGDARFQNWTNSDGSPAGDLTGGWAQRYVIKNETLRQQYREGKWNGVSLAGPALLEEVAVTKSSDTAPPHSPQPQEPEMDPIQIQQMISKAVTDAVAAVNAPKPVTIEDVQKCVTESIAKALQAKPEEGKAKGSALRKPVLKSYAPDDVKRHSMELQSYTLLKSMEESTDAEETLELAQQLQEVEKAKEESGLFEQKPAGKTGGLPRGKRSNSALAKGVRDKLGQLDPALLQLAMDEDHLVPDGGDPLEDLLKGMDDDTFEALNGEPRKQEPSQV